jgi:hypothetical protein
VEVLTKEKKEKENVLKFGINESKECDALPSPKLPPSWG